MCIEVKINVTVTMMMLQNERSKVSEDAIYPAALAVNTSVSGIYDTDQ